MKALVLGGAISLGHDIDALYMLRGSEWYDIVVACNDAGSAFPGHLDHWVSLHVDDLPMWERKRLAAGLNTDYKTWGGEWVTGSSDIGRVDEVLPVTLVGSSGMHAVDVALEIGADRVVMCGIPMDGQPHIDGTPWMSALHHRSAWEEAVEEKGYKDRVRSMSGWTSELLGKPTFAWLNG